MTRVQVEPTNALLAGARVESVERQTDELEGSWVVIRFSTGATLYADRPSFYIDTDERTP